MVPHSVSRLGARGGSFPLEAGLLHSPYSPQKAGHGDQSVAAQSPFHTFKKKRALAVTFQLFFFFFFFSYFLHTLPIVFVLFLIPLPHSFQLGTTLWSAFSLPVLTARLSPLSLFGIHTLFSFSLCDTSITPYHGSCCALQEETEGTLPSD